MFYLWPKYTPECPKAHSSQTHCSATSSCCESQAPCPPDQCEAEGTSATSHCRASTSTTVTVTHTVLVGATTQTLTGDASSGLTTAIGTPPVCSSTFLTIAQSSSTALFASSPPPSASLASLNTISGTIATTKTLNLVSAGATTATDCPASTLSSTLAHTRPHSSSAGIIAGSVIGSLAGLALLGLLISYCLKRKARLKLKLKRKVEKRDSQTEEALEALDHVIQQRDRALQHAQK